jgi:hypothetical protein
MGSQDSLSAHADEVIEWLIFLLRCTSRVVMWWTAPAPGDESP